MTEEKISPCMFAQEMLPFLCNMRGQNNITVGEIQISLAELEDDGILIKIPGGKYTMGSSYERSESVGSEAGENYIGRRSSRSRGRTSSSSRNRSRSRHRNRSRSRHRESLNKTTSDEEAAAMSESSPESPARKRVRLRSRSRSRSGIPMN